MSIWVSSLRIVRFIQVYRGIDHHPRQSREGMARLFLPQKREQEE